MRNVLISFLLVRLIQLIQKTRPRKRPTTHFPSTPKATISLHFHTCNVAPEFIFPEYSSASVFTRSCLRTLSYLHTLHNTALILHSLPSHPFLLPDTPKKKPLGVPARFPSCSLLHAFIPFAWPDSIAQHLLLPHSRLILLSAFAPFLTQTLHVIRLYTCTPCRRTLS